MGKIFGRYRYTKPNAKAGDPAIIISADHIVAYSGEIFIGWASTEPSATEEIKALMEEIVSNEERWIRFEEYFGKEHFAPVRAEFIRLLEVLLSRLKTNNGSLAQDRERQIKDIIETKTLPF